MLNKMMAHGTLGVATVVGSIALADPMDTFLLSIAYLTAIIGVVFLMHRKVQ